MSANEQSSVVEENNTPFKLSVQAKVFSNSLICKEITKSIRSLKDLNNFRLTNTYCYNLSLTVWQNRVCVSLGSSDPKPRIVEFMENIDKLDVFQSYKLYSYSLPLQNMDNEWRQPCDTLGLLQERGTFIKHLTLDRCCFNLKRLMSTASNLTPNLQSLKIVDILQLRGPPSEGLKAGEFQPHNNLKVLHMSDLLDFPNWDFLEYFPNLVELKMSKSVADDLMSTVSKLRAKHAGSILKLKTLDLIHNKASLQSLHEANLSLEHLRLNLVEDVDRNVLQNVFTSQCATLKSLKLYGYITSSPKFSSTLLQAPFCSLTEFQFNGNMVSSLIFLSWMPNLKKLVANFYCDEDGGPEEILKFNIDHIHHIPNDPNKFEDLVMMSKLALEAENFQHEQLEYFQMDYKFCKQSLELLGKWMPNLKVLKTVLCDETLQVVCQQWRKLEELQLLIESSITDLGLTGLIARGADDQVRQPNLTDLTELVSFGFKCFRSNSLLTDYCVHYGFLQMPKLQTLKLYVSPILTDIAESLLKQNIEDVQVIRDYGNCQDRVSCLTRTRVYYESNDYIWMLNFDDFFDILHLF